MKNRRKKLRTINVENTIYKWLVSSYNKELKIWCDEKLIYEKREDADLIITPKVVEEKILNLRK